ncbi:hypothetical protein [Nocardia seriolae]|uniref:hypothetical protein n=1 Tax=Nocardia seriolae TaxID=37332 RepID=UPI001160960D|nr:hypothetical protein [Nocardia seriolae]QOW36272.1 hypothetical protein IMZ23_16200 [Nocardia seriolae]QUN16221.1 hypothetical protein KEC46_28750 [Nocardia seriolae]WNJ56725.1 hypothetical protein RMO66_25020 [Nocardia seriolae]
MDVVDGRWERRQLQRAITVWSVGWYVDHDGLRFDGYCCGVAFSRRSGRNWNIAKVGAARNWVAETKVPDLRNIAVSRRDYRPKSDYWSLARVLAAVSVAGASSLEILCGLPRSAHLGDQTLSARSVADPERPPLAQAGDERALRGGRTGRGRCRGRGARDGHDGPPGPAPVLSAAEAQSRLCERGLPFVFFTDSSGGRGHLLYRRYGNELALVGPAGGKASS